MTTSFADLGVPPDLVAVLNARGIADPFDIQRATIPDALAGRDVLGRAPTGSGKTIAFGLPLVVHLGKSKPRRPRGLILSPTRELADQIRRELEPLAKALDRSVLSIYGGVGFAAQLNGLRDGADLIVACPGRLLDLLEQGQLTLDQVDQVVVDEADRMADMGFLPAVRELLDLTASNRQTVLFSATLDRDVQVLIDHYQNDPVTHEVGDVEPDMSQVTHRFISTKAEQKLALAADLIDDAGATIVFCRTRHGVDRVARQLKSAGIRAGWIHGGRSQSQRDAALHSFVTGKVQALVATDVAARGIHVDDVACVIHFDPPADSKDYVHRSGRTARAGAGGMVVSFINRDQVNSAKRMISDVGMPPTEIEPTPEVSDKAKHVQMDVRSRKTGSSSNRQGKNSAPATRATRAPVKQAGSAKQADPARQAHQTKPGAQTDRKVPVKQVEEGTSEADDEREWRVTTTKNPRAVNRPARSKGGKPGGSKSKAAKAKGSGSAAKTKKKSTRSGKPRPKNKKAPRT